MFIASGTLRYREIVAVIDAARALASKGRHRHRRHARGGLRPEAAKIKNSELEFGIDSRSERGRPFPGLSDRR